MIRTRIWRKLKFISYISFLLPPQWYILSCWSYFFFSVSLLYFYPFSFFPPLSSPLLNKSISPTLPSFSSSRFPLPSLLSPLLHLPYPPFFLLFSISPTLPSFSSSPSPLPSLLSPLPLRHLLYFFFIFFPSSLLYFQQNIFGEP